MPTLEFPSPFSQTNGRVEITITVDTAHVDEVLHGLHDIADLGGFTVKTATESYRPASIIEPSFDEDGQLQYDSRFITMLREADNVSYEPAITRQDMRDFAAIHHYSPKNASRVHTRLCRALDYRAKWEPTEPSLVIKGEPVGTQNSEKEVMGIRLAGLAQVLPAIRDQDSRATRGLEAAHYAFVTSYLNTLLTPPDANQDNVHQASVIGTD